MHQHFLQSDAWAALEKSEGHQVFQDSTDHFSYLAIKKSTKLGSYLFVPYGPSLKTSETDPTLAEKSLLEALESLTSLAKREKAIFIRLEPTYAFPPEIMAKNGFTKSKDIDPAHTWLLDLTPSEADLLHGMAQGTRTRRNQFPKKNLTIEITRDPSRISELTRLQHKLAGEKGITPYEEAHLKAELSQPFASLYLVHYPDPDDNNRDKIIAASLFFDDEATSTRFYMQSAADSAYKKLPATAGLLSAAIFDAKAKGLKYFDFWGIAPDDAPADHPWAGFTRFKKSFGGFPRTYTGTYDYVLDNKKYNLYKLLRKLNRKLHKI